MSVDFLCKNCDCPRIISRGITEISHGYVVLHLRSDLFPSTLGEIVLVVQGSQGTVFYPNLLPQGSHEQSQELPQSVGKSCMEEDPPMTHLSTSSVHLYEALLLPPRIRT